MFLLKFKTFYLGGKPVAVQSARIHKGCVLAKLEGVETPEQATLLRGKTVCVDRTGVRLPKGTVFIADLIGCRVLNDDTGEELGTLRDVLTLPSSDVYVIGGAGKQYMIPAVKEFIRLIDVEAGVVRVHLIEGFATDEN